MESGPARHCGGCSWGGGRTRLKPADVLAAPCWRAWGSARGGDAQPELGGAAVTSRRALCWLGAAWASVDLPSAARARARWWPATGFQEGEGQAELQPPYTAASPRYPGQRQPPAGLQVAPRLLPKLTEHLQRMRLQREWRIGGRLCNQHSVEGGLS